MQEAPDSSEGGHIHWLAVRLPCFWPGLWFTQAEAQFALRHQWEDKVQLRDILDGVPTCGRSWEHHLHINSEGRALHHPQGRASMPPVIIPWSMCAPATDERRDGGPQTIPFPVPPREPGTRHVGWLPGEHMVQQAAATHPNCTGRSGRR